MRPKVVVFFVFFLKAWFFLKEEEEEEDDEIDLADTVFHLFRLSDQLCFPLVCLEQTVAGSLHLSAVPPPAAKYQSCTCLFIFLREAIVKVPNP